jgi:predicted nucleic-acid-binding protein
MSERPALYAVDANVILRHLLGDDARLSAAAGAIFAAVEAGEARVMCDPVNLAEVVWVLRSFYKMANREIGEGLGTLLKADGFVMPDKGRYIRALESLSEHDMRFGDACVCATAVDECGGRLLSFDRKLSSMGGVSRMETLG